MHRFPVVSETFVVTQAAALVARGVNLRLLAMEPQPADGPADEQIAPRALLERVARPQRAAGLRDLGRELVGLVASRPDRALRLARLPALGAEAPAALAQAAMLAREPEFDLLHCQFGTAGLQAQRHAQLGALRFRKLVVHLRGYDITHFVEERGRRIYDALFRRADLLISNCERFAERAIALGADPARVVALPSPIDTERFAYRLPPRPDGRAVRLISVGRLVEKKGFEYAIRAVGSLVAAGRDVTYSIVGDGELRATLQARIDERGLGSRVVLLGARPQGEIVERLGAADVLLAPSVSARSGDADGPVNSLKEAMAVGLPVVATAHGGIPELVDDGQTGLLVPERDADALASRLTELLDAPERWPSLSRAARERVVTGVDQAVVTDRLLELYRGLLEGGRRT